MAVYLDYQAVYCDRRTVAVSLKLQLIAAVLLLGALCWRVWIKVESTDLGYQLARERQETMSLDMQRRELELQLSVLLRPDSLFRTAHEKLGLERLNSDHARKLGGKAW
jgi:hypothetical protein